MLRVTSVLYLQQVWSRPSSMVIEEVANPIAPALRIAEQEEVEQEHPEDLVSSIIIQEQDIPEQEQEEQEQEQETDIDIDDEQEQISIAASRAISFQEASICSSLIIPSPSVITNRSETVVIIQPQPQIPATKLIGREFYDDDIDLDDEDDEEISTPPSTPSSKFSPKRMLHRAKSSINDESVRNLGRRTSMFLEKFSYQPSLPATPNLRRQSSKLTNKGKTLSKKLKRVLSFHHTK
ncbi:hypothetical protein INT46_011000 [Mucor plumbeus]|uniref:Uncharacterized protein n=1 Tax=Mucor plumbeus TaxID=97098 RepID=A0A8H7USU3_9FUNG|nr:hypothetical protein INT46_011000 [Mucor plumbeus]